MSDFLGSLIDFGSSLYDKEFASDEASFSRNFSADQAREQRSWQEGMRANQYQTAVKDIEAAGLNPMLAYMHGGAGVPSGATASGATASPPASARFTESQKNSSAMEVMDSQRKNIDADTTLKNTQEEALRTTTPVSIAKLKQDVEESLARMQELVSRGAMQSASAEQSRENAENLRLLRPQIEATTKHLRSLVSLNEAQIPAIAAQIGKTTAETKEILQRVSEDLPKIEGMLKDIELSHKQASLGGEQIKGQVRSVPVLGHLIELFKHLSGVILPWQK